ncbi:MAG: NADH-quinone oxidoreductase subunit L [Coriobacteriales bacterium]|nr:NADH-quinone oxidoreductase subunit L [Coriobacteriales bacterium]
MELAAYSWVLPLLPLAAFAVVLATGRKLPRQVAPALGITTVGLVFLASLYLASFTASGQEFQASTEWLKFGAVTIDFGILVDPLTATMLVVVAFVSLLVQVYSLGYMAEDDRFRWYYGAISLFTAAMLGVVLSNGWLLMYMCWEVMGLASYLLIGFWYADDKAPPAAMKAFLVTRFGDVGFGLALVIMFLTVGSFTFETVFHSVETHAWAGPTLIACALLLFMGAMGKSAQFPLHVWLPDAMAGPTPGSALIHAATMVAAGVYLVARSFPLFEASPVTLTVVGTVGTITAVMGALIALAMNDIKKVLAYSTISQLGLMFLALGTGSWVAAMFHLMTHAFFKALLFLGAGSVIHATHTQDLHEMGGLWRKMPWTTATWVLGALSLAGIPPLAGFWSKDEILLSALRSGQTAFLVAGLFTAALTAFYMGRATLLAFFVAPGPQSKSAHAHESPWVMTAPLVVLAGLAVTVGLVGSPLMGYAFAGFLGEHEAAEPSLILAGVAVGIATAAIALAWSSYLKGFFEPDGYFRSPVVTKLLSRKFWMDEIYHHGVIRPVIWVSEGLRRTDNAVVDGVVRAVGWVGLRISAVLAVFDRKGVDGAVDSLGNSVTEAGEVRRIHTGNVQTYLMCFVVAVVLLVVVFAR